MSDTMKNNIKIPFSYLKNPVHFLALGFGSGLLPKAPGTFGTIAAIPLFLMLSQFNLWLFISVTIFISIMGIFICGYTSKSLGVHDHSGIVIDEIAGYLITMIAVPAEWLWILTGFLLFRFFDILKPWPISWVDKKIHGGFGIMLDDVIAGLLSLLCIHLLMIYFS